MKLSKADRNTVFFKYQGRCAYCGCELQKGWHVDHIEAFWHTLSESEAVRAKVRKGSHTLENMNPACARCNRWKGTMTIEKFREEIQIQPERLLRYSNQFKMAMDYGLIVETCNPVIFYFETIRT